VNAPLHGAPGLAVLETQPVDFSLDLTLGCGQVFHWERVGAGYVGLMGDVPAYVEQAGSELRLSPGVESVAARYFALDHRLQAIYATFPKDPAMDAALEFCRGLRLIRQPFWECLATFITSAMKQVPHIAQMSHSLRRRFGRAISWQGQTLYAYPTPERIAMASEADLRECRLGFRAKNLLGAARMVAAGEVNLDAIAQLEDESARRELCRLPGVGVKVANCALLFAYERPRAFPIDVWIERILRELYFTRKRKVTIKRLKAFSEDYFGPYSGYAQQYLFHHARKTWKLRERQAVK
jgi:N-glycosylase/DNA lyase